MRVEVELPEVGENNGHKQQFLFGTLKKMRKLRKAKILLK